MASSSSTMPIEITTAIGHQTKGNALFVDKEFGKAIREYHRSLMIMRGLQNTTASLGLPGGATPEAQRFTAYNKEMSMTIAKCYGNLAACIVAVETRSPADYDRAFDYATNVLDMDGQEFAAMKTKAKWRQVKALKLAKKYQKAIDLGTALQNSGADYDLKRLIDDAKAELKKERALVDAELRSNMSKTTAK